MHELISIRSCITTVIHESRFLRQTRPKAEIVGLTRMNDHTLATPSLKRILPYLAIFYNLPIRKKYVK